MKIEDVVNRVVVIDNIDEEGIAIKKVFKDADVLSSYIKILPDGNDNDIPRYLHPRDLIFVDLLLDEKAGNINTNISRIINIINRIQPADAKFYGLVLWTKHKELADIVIGKIGRAAFVADVESVGSDDEEELSTEVRLSNPPLFIICLDKTKYMNDGTWDFSNLPKDINETLQSSKIAYFSLTWKRSIIDSVENVINGIYQLSTDFVKHEDELAYILKALSKNETGEKGDENLTKGAYQAFDSLLHSELSVLIRDETLPDLSKINSNPYGDDTALMQSISASINTKLFIDDVGLNPNEVVPGNIYRLLDDNSPLKVDDAEKAPIPIKDENDKYIDGKDYDRINIAIELTPPCDFTNKKIHSRLVGGYVFSFPIGDLKYKKKTKVFEPIREDKRYSIGPIFIPESKEIKCILFDFRYLWTLKDEELKDNAKYQLWFKAKPGLFADILQKFSSHASRLGINDIHL